MEIRNIDADILIIGGGSAGCLAASRALQLNPELSVVIFEKGDIKYSGCITRGMDALNMVAIPNVTSPELYLEALRLETKGILDEPPSYEMAKRSYDLLKRLERWGAYFPVNKDGSYRTLQYHRKGKFLTEMEEPDLKLIVARKAFDRGAKVVNRVMGVKLLLDDGRVAGAVGMNVRTGELVVCRANAVILTAGGQARFSLPNSGYLYGVFDYPGNTGDGYTMAFDAGAGLKGMECGRRTINIKDANAPLLAITLPRGGKILDIFDNIILEGQCHGRDIMPKIVAEGRGPLRVRLSHLPEEMILEIERFLFTVERPMQERFFKKRDFNFRTGDLELWPTEVHICGGHSVSGIHVDEKARTDVAGLYAAGDTASVPKQHLTGAFVFGEIAAEEAVRYVADQPRTRLDDNLVRQVEARRNARFTSTGRHISVQELEYKVRRFIGDYVISPKNEYKLNRWLEWSDRFRDEIDNEVRVSNGHELTKLYEVENIVQCACLSARASIERKESRWGYGHLRTDFPDTDDANFKCHMMLRKGDSDRDVRVSKQDVIRLKS
ncbi:MAG: FAD-binding protein [Desulfobacteraceae bacterium]|nr:FAD-binding protein [Desulfobacteraceae bacterium]